MDSSSQQATHFISLFAKKFHAERWAQKWGTNNIDETCPLFRIDPSKLKDTQVFKAPNLAETLQIDAPPPTNFGTEYLALHTIPRSAVKCLCTMTVYAVKETVPSRSPSQQPSRPPLKLRRRSPSFDPWKELGWFDNNLEENVESGADG